MTLDQLVASAAAVSLLSWIYLTFFRHRFWRADQRLSDFRGGGDDVSVVAIVPARNEAAFVAHSIVSLLRQRHAPALRIVVVDDDSDDGTAEAARNAARQEHGDDRLVVLAARPRPQGWTGKLWAVSEGLRYVEAQPVRPSYVLLTDADIRHSADSLGALVAKAEADGLDLVSSMVRLHCASTVEKLLIPPFVYFFQKLYPFAAVNDPASRIAAAAGGCMLLRLAALRRIGGMSAIRGALIDDCALATAIKRGGRIWLGFSVTTISQRPYHRLSEVWRMVTRSAYAQLRYSIIALAAAAFAMSVVYLVPPLALAFGIARSSWLAVVLAGMASILMARTYLPTVRLYRLSPLWATALPVAALLYTMMTVDSARRHWLGRGGEWKGRVEGGKTGLPATTGNGAQAGDRLTDGTGIAARGDGSTR